MSEDEAYAALFRSEIDEVRAIVDKVPEDYRRLQVVAEAAAFYFTEGSYGPGSSEESESAQAVIDALRAAGYLKEQQPTEPPE